MMNPPFPGSVLEHSRFGDLAMEEKRKIVYELVKVPKHASEMLLSWSRKDLLEILCEEMGKERKYTGLAKHKLVELLLRIVTEKTSRKLAKERDSASNSPSKPPVSSKRQRKAENPSRLPIETNVSSWSDMNIKNTPRYCQNVACKATLNSEDAFCKRCSCCICYKFDDNKDPSLWLFCGTDNLSENNPCGMSCHIECAFKNEKTGMAISKRSLDGSFYCVCCGKINDLLPCLRKQFTIAKDARRVDILCHRISLSYKLLHGTDKYKKLLELVNMAMKKLETEVGPINGSAAIMARGIVNRLRSGIEIQKLCLHAVDLIDLIHNNALQSSHESKTKGREFALSVSVRFDGISSTSLTIVVESKDGSPFPDEVSSFIIWQRRGDTPGYPAEPTCKLTGPNWRFLLSELNPATKYVFKAIALGNGSELGKWEVDVMTGVIPEDASRGLLMQEEPAMPPSSKTNSSDLSNPSEGDESNTAGIFHDLNKLPGDYHAYSDKPQLLDLEKTADLNDVIDQQDTPIGTIASREEAMAPEGTPGHSVSALDEEPNSVIQADARMDPTSQPDQSRASDAQMLEDSGIPPPNGMSMIPYGFLETVLPVTPSKLEASKDGAGRIIMLGSDSSSRESWLRKPVKELKAGNASKKRSMGNCEGLGNERDLEGDYEYCVKVVRWLECEGHIETNFRVKFLTWFSMRATQQDRKVVSVFVDTLVDDPPSLAGQLVDAFSEEINRKRQPEKPAHGFCMRMWH